jgi:hypothetical protein
MNSGARAALPKPDNIGQKASFVKDTIFFLETLKKCLKVTPACKVATHTENFLACMDEISTKKELGDILLAVDSYISSVMARAVTFISRKSELVCESISRSSSSQPLSISISVEGNSPLHAVLSSGNIFYGESSEQLLFDKIYSQIGSPANRLILVVPFKCLGRVVAVTYGDFGSRQPTAVEIDLIAILAKHSGLVYENALYRKKFEKMLQT